MWFSIRKKLIVNLFRSTWNSRTHENLRNRSIETSLCNDGILRPVDFRSRFYFVSTKSPSSSCEAWKRPLWLAFMFCRQSSQQMYYLTFIWHQVIFSWKSFEKYISLVKHWNWNLLHMLIHNHILFLFIFFNDFI